MDPTTALLWGVLAPLALSAAVAGAAGARAPGLDARGWPGALALALGFLAAFQGIKGLPLLAPRESIHWVAWAAVVGLGLGLIEALAPTRPRLRWGARAAGVLFLVVVTVRRKASLWEEGGAALAIVLLAAGWLVLFLALDLLRSALPAGEPDPGSGGAGAGLALMGVIGTGSVVLGLAGSALQAQLGGALALSVAPLLGAALWRPARPWLRGAAGPAGMVWGGLLANAALFGSDLPRAIPVLLLLAPLGANAARLPWLRSRPGWQRAPLATAVALVPVAIAGWLAWQKAEELGGSY